MVCLDACRVYNPATGEIVSQVGDTETDHSYWGRPENQTGYRPSKKGKFADLLGNAASSMIAASIVLSKDGAVKVWHAGHTHNSTLTVGICGLL